MSIPAGEVGEYLGITTASMRETRGTLAVTDLTLT
jgi:hypothetical protein